MNLVSAVIITHNRKELVVQAIESVKKQTYKNIELIVVDDASDDGSKNLLESLSKEKNFKYIYIEKKDSKGGNHARNVGIAASKGKYIAFLDDDDEWLPEKTEKQVNFLDNNRDFGVVHCAKIFLYDDGSEVYQKIDNIAFGECNKLVWQRVLFTTSCLMVRKELFDEIGYFDENLLFWQEYELSIRACQKSKLGVVCEHLVVYRVFKRDKNRLTNQIDGWKTAVKYIEDKHKKLLDELSDAEMKKFKLHVYKDGFLRAVNSCDKKNQRKYLNLMYSVENSFVNLIKIILNRFGLYPLLHKK